MIFMFVIVIVRPRGAFADPGLMVTVLMFEELPPLILPEVSVIV